MRPVFDTPRLRKSLWHQLGEEEQRVIMFQLQRLLGVQMTHSFHPDTQELVIKDVVFPGRCVCVCVWPCGAPLAVVPAICLFS